MVASEQDGHLPCPGGPHRLPDGQAAIRALSWAKVAEIRARFRELNPYGDGGDLLELEQENLEEDGQQELWCLAISAKRYCLYTLDDDGEPQLRKWSEHGLGHLLNPTNPDSEDRDWMRQVCGRACSGRRSDCRTSGLRGSTVRRSRD